jgi:hypothetical protein
MPRAFITLRFSLSMLRILNLVPGWPKADECILDARGCVDLEEAVNGENIVTLIWYDNVLKQINDSRMAAADNRKFLKKLAKKYICAGKTVEDRMQLWAGWLRNGLTLIQDNGSQN